MTNFGIILMIATLSCNLALALNDCIIIDDCPEALKYIEKKRHDPQTLAILRKAHCGLLNTGTSLKAKVFCEKIPVFQEAQQAKSKLALLPPPNKCGLQTPVFRVTHGQIAELEDYPWVALFRFKNKTSFSYQCHGTLISVRYVVTAAHCLSYPPSLKDRLGSLHEIILGEYDIRTSLDCLPEKYGRYCAPPVQTFTPESIHVHPRFGSSNSVSDIGLIRLNRNVVFSDFVRPICLPFNAFNLSPGQLLLITGWGKTENRAMSNVKLKAKIFYRSSETCEQFNVDATQICAGSTTGQDTCKGDSGGPLMLNQQFSDSVRSTLIGIVSYGGRCGSRYAIYTNVTAFTSWILDTIQD